MTLYFDTKVQFFDVEAISTASIWHPNEPIFAVASYSNEKGGSVTIFDDTGTPIKNITYPVHASSQATVLCWHPEKKVLLTGWENGEIYAWFDGKREFVSINGPHKSPIMLMEFSEKGGRVITSDSMGVLTGWRYENQGQFLTMFTHDLKDALLHVTFRNSIQTNASKELTNLVAKAVAGDESALDMLTTWRPRTALRNLAHTTSLDNFCFYTGTQSGTLYYINQAGTCTEIRRESIPIIQMLWHPKQDSVIFLMEDITIGHYEVDANGQITELDRVKLSGKVSGYKSTIIWVTGSALAIVTGDLSIRIWDIESNDNYVLSMELSNVTYTLAINHQFNATEVFTCISFCRENQTLSAGTNQGNLFTWRKLNYNKNIDFPENAWQLTNITSVRGTIKSLTWGMTEANRCCMMVNCLSNVYILKEQTLLSDHTRLMWVTQKKSNEILIENQQQKHSIVKTENSIMALCLNEMNLCTTNGRQVSVYKINHSVDDASFSITFSNTFNVECVQIFIHEQNIVVLGNDDAKLYSLSGVVLQDFFFTDQEGKTIGAALLNQYLTFFTMNGFLKTYDISKHEIKSVHSPKCAFDLFDNFGEIIMAKANCNGTLLAMTIANESLVPDGKFYVWNIESNALKYYEFHKKNEITYLPINFYWDTDDPRMVVCETKSMQNGKNIKANIPEIQAYILFTGKNTDIHELELINMAFGDQVINLCIPYVVILKLNTIERFVLRDFKGLEECDSTTRSKVLNFSLHIAQENMDQAFSCIRSLKSDTVWSNLARLCVQTGRLDVAKVCLGHLKRARSVRALRKAMEDTNLEHECCVAILAIELGMIAEAEALYKKAGRYDLLNKLYQACGRFDEALEIAENLDRVHLKNTYFKYAEWLKDMGKTQKAIQYYEKTNNLMHNVSQILIDDPAALKKYMQNTTDPELLKWFAQYIESSGDMEAAFKIYQKSEDIFSQVRILCFIGQIQKADTIARNSGDRAACYHLARYYENSGNFQDAIQLYTKAETYGNAVRICKENDLQDELWNVACTARAKDKALAAIYFEENGDFRRAVELYHRAGMLHKAVEMAFKSQQSESLQVIASELDSSDPELVNKCADFFISVTQPYKAVQLLAKARQLDKALEVCAKHAVPVTETLSELLTPQKDEISEGHRIQILIKIGEILQEQGDYHAATKKFTQAGDKVKAMKSLLKSGDTEKIIFFAGMSRQKEIYIMAANYLQALSWQSDPKILKNIVTFYTKGHAYNLLANFYANCAQVEIDDFHSYEKALKALQEAAKCLSKAETQQKIMENLQISIISVREMIEIQDAYDRKDFSNVIIACKSKIDSSVIPPIRVIDFLSLLIEALISSGQYSEALYYLKDLSNKKPDWMKLDIIDRHLVEKLVSETGVNVSSFSNFSRRKSTADTTQRSDSEEEILEVFD